jgi:CHAD domain-containing protein
MAKAQHIPGIDCNALALEGIRSVLLGRLDEMCSLRDRALEWSDPEGVHDMRVSSRRLRAAIEGFTPYLRKRGLKNSVKQIKSVADALGEVRDNDVAMIALLKLKAIVPDEAAATVKQLMGVRDAARKTARQDLRRAISRSAIKRMQTDFAEAIEAVTKLPTSKQEQKHRKAKRTYIQVAQSTVLQRLMDVEKLSRGFYEPLKVRPLHKMRIAAKHLRYALELFEQCLGSEAVPFARRVARLQSSLGELHDCDIWIGTFGKQLGAVKREVTNDGAAGSLWLLNHFIKLHSKHLRSALAQWEEWECNDVGQQLRRLLKPEQESST